MKLYLVWQSVNINYDTYDSFVCAAPNARVARNACPVSSDDKQLTPRDWANDCPGCWASRPADVHVKCIGEAAAHIKTPRLICASFNAG